MDLILHQLADLFLRSIPTAVLFLLLVGAYRMLVHAPLLKVLAERRERTSGAMTRAEAAVRQADARAQEYEARLRTARAEIFRAREERLQAMQRERERVLEEARHAAHERVRAAQERLDAEAAEARGSLDSKADSLAAEILRVIVPSAAAAGAVSGHSTRSAY